MRIRPADFEENPTQIDSSITAEATQWSENYFNNAVDKDTQIKFQCEPGKSIRLETSGETVPQLEMTCRWSEGWSGRLEEPASCICNLK